MQSHQQIDAVGLMDHAGFLDPHGHIPATDPFLAFLIQEFYPDDSHGLLSLAVDMRALKWTSTSCVIYNQNHLSPKLYFLGLKTKNMQTKQNNNMQNTLIMRTSL